MGGLGGGYAGAPTGHSEIGPISSKPKKRPGGLGGGVTGGGRYEKPGGGGRGGGGRGGGGGGGGGSIDLSSMMMPGGGGTGVNVAGPERPDLPAIDPQADFDPNLTGYADEYKGHLADLKAGTGFAADVLAGQQADQKAAATEQAAASAASAGIPFDAGSFGAEFDRGTNAAMAQEKIAREQMVTGAYQGGLPLVSRPSEERFARLDLDLKRDLEESGDILDRYKTDVGKYGTDVNAAIGSNNALLGFLSSLMGNMTSMSTGGNSYNYG